MGGMVGKYFRRGRILRRSKSSGHFRRGRKIVEKLDATVKDQPRDPAVTGALIPLPKPSLRFALSARPTCGFGASASDVL